MPRSHPELLKSLSASGHIIIRKRCPLNYKNISKIFTNIFSIISSRETEVPIFGGVKVILGVEF